MQLLKEITPLDVLGEDIDIYEQKFDFRKSARSIIFDEDEVALMYVSKEGYYKLPGGGLEQDESIVMALHREVKEETGCVVEILDLIGCTLEYRVKLQKENLIQLSYCYTSKLINRGKTQFTASESARGFKLVWVSPNEALRLVKANELSAVNIKYITARESAFLEEVCSKL